MKCRFCAVEMDTRARFCPKCGASVRVGAPDRSAPSTVERDWRGRSRGSWPALATARSSTVRTFCAVHHSRETLLACGRCLRPYCTTCLTHTVVGMRCQDCGGISVAKRSSGTTIGAIALSCLALAATGWMTRFMWSEPVRLAMREHGLTSIADSERLSFFWAMPDQSSAEMADPSKVHARNLFPTRVPISTAIPAPADTPIDRARATYLDPRILVGDPNGNRGTYVILRGMANNVSQKDGFTWIQFLAEVNGQNRPTESIVVRFLIRQIKILKQECYVIYGVVSGEEDVIQVATGVAAKTVGVTGYAWDSIDRTSQGCVKP